MYIMYNTTNKTRNHLKHSGLVLSSKKMEETMKYEELENEMMSEFDSIINKNKELYKQGINDVSLYKLDFMASHNVGCWNGHTISCDDSFEESYKDMCKIKDELESYQVANVGEPRVSIEDNEYAYFSYDIEEYTPIDTFDDIDDWNKRDLIKDYIAKRIGLSSGRYLKCEVLNLYKDNIITLEQLKKAHKSC